MLVAYIGAKIGDGMGVDRFEPTSRRHLTDWHGNKIGTCALGKCWPVRSYIGSKMYQAYATVSGIEYTGRTFGEGMAVKLKPLAKQPRRL